MSKKEDNFLTNMFENRHIQEEKGKRVKKLQELEQLEEGIKKCVEHIIEYNIPPIKAQLDRMEALITDLGQKVDISLKAQKVLDMLELELKKKP